MKLIRFRRATQTGGCPLPAQDLGGESNPAPGAGYLRCHDWQCSLACKKPDSLTPTEGEELASRFPNKAYPFAHSMHNVSINTYQMIRH